MEITQSIYAGNEWRPSLPRSSQAQLVFAFGDRSLASRPDLKQDIAQAFPAAEVVGCSTSGEIHGAECYDSSLSLTAVHFQHTRVKVVSALLQEHNNSYVLAKTLVEQLPEDDLQHVLIIADGQLVNGSELAQAINQSLPPGIQASGGLAGDGDRFEETQVWHNQQCAVGLVALIGLYGDNLTVGCGFQGGWKAFGPNRVITQSKENQLFELDNTPALDLYKTFLGKYSQKLPASALLFPLSVTTAEHNHPLVRTILSIDEQAKSMTFAGNMPEGASCQLMHANYENLVEGAEDAAQQAMSQMQGKTPQLALLISCVGRRLVLTQRVEEELEVIQDCLGGDDNQCVMTGFYSYGELSPAFDSEACSLHNQTMTITLLAE